MPPTRLMPVPADPDAFAAYLTERADAGLCNGTLDGDWAAIAHRHHRKASAIPPPPQSSDGYAAGLRRIPGTAPRRQTHPLTVAELPPDRGEHRPATSIGIRDRAVLLLGYAAALRPSEVAALHLADVGVDSNGLLITIRRSKTEQEGRGQIVGVVAGLHAATDPIRALRAWLDLRPPDPVPLHPGAGGPPNQPRRRRAADRQRPGPQPRRRRRPRRPRRSAATRCAPDTPRPRLPTARRSTGSPPRPDTAT